MKRKLHIIYYKDKKREWRWRIKRCGRIVAESGEGYNRLYYAKKALYGIMWCFSIEAFTEEEL